MPVYEYECKQCHREFEYQQRMADPDKTVCEACGGALDRIISRTAFQLKGSGWYKDLYSSSKPDAKPADAAASGDAKPAASSETPAASSSSEKKESSPSTPSTPSTPSPSTGSSSGGGGSNSGSSE
jgi:putative FmdB family regulatory protein